MSPSALPNVDHLSIDWLGEADGQTVSSFDIQDLVGEGYNSRLYRLNECYTDRNADAPSY